MLSFFKISHKNVLPEDALSLVDYVLAMKIKTIFQIHIEPIPIYLLFFFQNLARINHPHKWKEKMFYFILTELERTKRWTCNNENQYRFLQRTDVCLTGIRNRECGVTFCWFSVVLWVTELIKVKRCVNNNFGKVWIRNDNFDTKRDDLLYPSNNR